MNELEIENFAITVMEHSEAMYFTTLSPEGIPYTRAMFNLRNKKSFPKQAEYTMSQGKLLVLIATNTSSEKVEHLKINPLVSLYYCIPIKFHGVMLGGKMEEVDNIKVKEALWEESWNRYYSKGLTDPDFIVYKLQPSILRIWAASRGKHELQMM